MGRPDETQYRLTFWTRDSGAAERLAVQVLLASGFQDPDPSHPYGGPDGGRDAVFTRDGELWVMAAFFPHGTQPFPETKAKFTADIESAKKHNPAGVAFVTNQEITLGQRDTLRGLVSGFEVLILHLERIAAVLDQPHMAGVRQQFLGIDPGPVPLNLRLEVSGTGYFPVEGDELREILLSSADEHDRQDAAGRRTARPGQQPHPNMLTRIMGNDPPPRPPTSDEVERLIIDRRNVVETEWGRIQDYVIALTRPALHFTITNTAASFLYDLRAVITFVGAHGAEKLQIEDFEHQKLLDPDYERPHTIYDPPGLGRFKPRGYPIEWQNKDSGLEVRITLPELPPGEAFEWSSDGLEDVVLVAPSDEPVGITWLVAAKGYGMPFIGPADTVPTEELSSLDAARVLLGSGDAD